VKFRAVETPGRFALLHVVNEPDVIRRVVVSFPDRSAAVRWAQEQGWAHYAVAPVTVVVPRSS